MHKDIQKNTTTYSFTNVKYCLSPEINLDMEYVLEIILVDKLFYLLSLLIRNKRLLSKIIT